VKLRLRACINGQSAEPNCRYARETPEEETLGSRRRNAKRFRAEMQLQERAAFLDVLVGSDPIATVVRTNRDTSLSNSAFYAMFWRLLFQDGGSTANIWRPRMNGNISKPIRSEVLEAELERVSGNVIQAGAERTNSAPAATIEEAAFSFSTLLQRVDNDRELLRELLEIFKHEFPRYRAELRSAVAQKELKRVSSLGHALKGMFANLAADRATALAGNLERLGKGNETEELDAALEAFEAESTALLPILDSCLMETRR